MGFLLDLDLAPMEAKLAERLPSEPFWQFEPKWDGFRCLAFKSGAQVELRAKSGKSLSRYFPEMLAALAASGSADFVLDGELAIPRGETLSFGALQDRLHPAESRIRKLAAETPALLILFDCLATAHDGVLLAEALPARRAALLRLFERFAPETRTRLSPATPDRAEAERWFAEARDGLDGLVAKRLDGIYAPGRREMIKVKRQRSADCVVGGFRYEQATDAVGSLLLGLYGADGKLDHVGFTSSIRDAERSALTAKLEALRGGEGFTGGRPGGPSRWASERSAQWQPLRPELVVEVGYDQVTDGRFRHGTRLLRWRPDKAPRQCTREQLAEEQRPGRLIRTILGRK